MVADFYTDVCTLHFYEKNIRKFLFDVFVRQGTLDCNSTNLGVRGSCKECEIQSKLN